MSARGNCEKSWPHVPVLPGEAGGSCPAVTLVLPVALPAKNAAQVGSEELGEVP